jgi:hypothetical protein
MTIPQDAPPAKKEHFPKVDVDEVMAKIRDELNLKKGEASHTSRHWLSRKILGTRLGWYVKTRIKKTVIFRLFLGPLLGKIRGRRGTLSGYPRAVKSKDLLRHEDERFIKETYKHLLHRLPEPEGLDFWLLRLRQLGWPKVKILWLIHKSQESQIHSMPVTGLKTRYMFYRTGRLVQRIPVFGWFVRLIVSICRLPVLARKIENMERQHWMMYTEKEHARALHDDRQTLSSRLTRLEKRMGAIERSGKKQSRKKYP